MTQEERLRHLYSIRAELQQAADEKFQRGIGLPYTDELQQIDQQIEILEKRTPSPTSTSASDSVNTVISQTERSSSNAHPSRADQKKLCILEKLKEERYNEYKVKILSAQKIDEVQPPPHPKLPDDFDPKMKANKKAIENAIKEEDLIQRVTGRVQEGIRETKTQQLYEKDKDTIKIRTKSGVLIFNKNTGFVKLGKCGVSGHLNPQSQEAKVLLKLMTGKNYHATYEDLLGDNVSKVSKRNMSFIVRNLKKALGILPTEKAKNKDCIKNIRGYGYKLVIQSHLKHIHTHI